MPILKMKELKILDQRIPTMQKSYNFQYFYLFHHFLYKILLHVFEQF